MSSGSKNSRTPGNPLRKQKQADEQRAARKRQERLKKLMLWGIPVLLLILAAGGVLISRVMAARVYDLSGLGNGVPMVVQVHDPACPVCTALRNNVSRIEGDFDDAELQIKVARLDTPEGSAFARAYGAGFRTLLYFDGSGELVDVEIGLQEASVLSRRFREHIENSKN